MSRTTVSIGTWALVALIGVLASTAPASGADDFGRAQQLAWSGEREEARAVLRAILERDPDHADARVLLARTWAWDRQYDRAREELRRVLAARPDYTDASRALADVELWDDRPEDALAVADRGLTEAPDDAELLLRRARALEDLGREDEALAALDGYEAASTSPIDTRSMRRRMAAATLPNEAAVEFVYEDFSGGRGSREDVRFELGRRYDFGTVLGRLSLGRRGSSDGWLAEVDAYPKLPGRRYLYLNAGLGDKLYPTFRTGAELFQAFGGGWEGSLGFRYLDFDGTDVTIVTGSVAKYVGDWWFALRPSYSFKDSGDSRSISLSARRFFGERWQYVGFQVGAGESLVDGALPVLADRFGDSRLRVEMQRRVGVAWLVGAAATYRDEEFAGGDVRSWAVSVGIERWFACRRDR